MKIIAEGKITGSDPPARTLTTELETQLHELGKEWVKLRDARQDVEERATALIGEDIYDYYGPREIDECFSDAEDAGDESRGFLELFRWVTAEERKTDLSNKIADLEAEIAATKKELAAL